MFEAHVKVKTKRLLLIIARILMTNSTDAVPLGLWVTKTHELLREMNYGVVTLSASKPNCCNFCGNTKVRFILFGS
jgi:hypothetical protein